MGVVSSSSIVRGTSTNTLKESRYFESFSATCIVTFNVKESTKYLFRKIQKHQN